MDVGGGLAFTDTVTGLSLDVRVRTLVVHQAEGFSERGMSLSFGWDPTPSSPLGLTARVAPSWGGQAQGGAEALWSNQMAYGMGSHQMYGSGDRVDAEVGYGLPVGARFVGTPRVGLATSQYGRDYRVGYGLGVLDRDKLNVELGVDAQRLPGLRGSERAVVRNGRRRPEHRSMEAVRERRLDGLGRGADAGSGRVRGAPAPRPLPCAPRIHAVLGWVAPRRQAVFVTRQGTVEVPDSKPDAERGVPGGRAPRR